MPGRRVKAEPGQAPCQSLPSPLPASSAPSWPRMPVASLVQGPRPGFWGAPVALGRDPDHHRGAERLAGSSSRLLCPGRLSPSLSHHPDGPTLEGPFPRSGPPRPGRPELEAGRRARGSGTRPQPGKGAVVVTLVGRGPHSRSLGTGLPSDPGSALGGLRLVQGGRGR